jgi:hypothetical protein
MVGYVDIAVKIESKKRVSLIRIYWPRMVETWKEDGIGNFVSLGNVVITYLYFLNCGLILKQKIKSGFLLVVSMKRRKHNQEYVRETCQVIGCKLSMKKVDIKYQINE